MVQVQLKSRGHQQRVSKMIVQESRVRGRLGAIRLLMLLGVLATGLLGCGYSFQGSKSSLPSDVRSIYVPQVENNSAESGFGPLLTDALRDQFDRFGAVRVVDSPSEADATLETSVSKVRRSARTTTGATDRALQYDTTVTIDATLKRGDGTPLWTAQKLSVSKSFGGTQGAVTSTSADFSEGILSASDLAGLSTQEVLRSQQAGSLRSLAAEVARRIYNSSVRGDF